MGRRNTIHDNGGAFPRRSLPSAALGVVALVLNASTGSGQELRDAHYLAALRVGMEQLYRVEHKEAIRSFSEMSHRFPEHPGPPLARAVTVWLRELFSRQELALDRFISPGYFTRPSEREMPEADRTAFFEDIERAKALSERYLEIHPGNKDARYYLGAIEGALGTFAFTIDRSYMSALKHGKRAYQVQKAILEEDPNFYDAYLTVGTYEYILGNLPWYIKWLAALAGYHGSERRGFEYLVLAAQKSVFVADDARVLLMVLYVREKHYGYGLQLARQLHHRYPENFLFQLNEAQILERMRQTDQAVKTYLEVERKAAEGKENYQKLPLTAYRFTLANRLFKLDYSDEALPLYEKTLRDPAASAREKVLSHLRAGEILDLQGRREEAVSHYKRVQQLQDFEGSHKKAEQHLKKPYHDGGS